jgi:hypothetical protein
MLLGRLEIMDQAKVEHIDKISKIESAEEKQSIISEEKYKKLEEGKRATKKNEVILDNVKFGFDSEKKEFFLRVSNDGVEYQFTADQMLRLKDQLHKNLKIEINN